MVFVGLLALALGALLMYAGVRGLNPLALATGNVEKLTL